MPRYYFHVADGRRVYRDPVGVELVGIEAAREHALRDARTLLESWMARSLKPWRIVVADDVGATSFVVSLVEATVSEAIPLFRDADASIAGDSRMADREASATVPIPLPTSSDGAKRRSEDLVQDRAPFSA